VKNTDYIRVKPGEKMDQVGSVSFDASSFEIWTALLNGVTLVIFTTDTVLSTYSFISSIRKERLIESLVINNWIIP
jgi:non-ribosomal peptide synthetase component F